MGWFSEADVAELKKRGVVIEDNLPGVAIKHVPVKSQAPTGSPVKAAPAATGPCQSLWIPNWTPGLLNQWDGRHWSVRAKIKKADAAIVRVYFEGARLQRTTGPRRVSIMLVLPKGKRSCDRDAVRKSTNDALVACGALFDDTPKYCLEGPVSYARAIGAESAVGTLIVLEDL